jgi:16S rRNA (cytidine1402-2'-O)-methyltransferase
VPGTLYIVATPIGNLEDLTFRALRVLKEADIIACEDTRHSAKLLGHYGISKKLISYWGEKEKAKSEEVMALLREGLSVALISDAGTPGISDPGAVLIRKAIEGGMDVVPIPGPSALIAALSISGLPTEKFTFFGFLPAKKTQRQKALSEVSLEPGTLVFYEAPHRIMDTLTDIEEIFGERKAAVIREITKLYEEAVRGNIGEVIETLEGKTSLGEYVIIVEGKNKEERSFDEALLEIKTLIKKGMGRKEAVKRVAGQYGLSKKELYEKSLVEEKS